MADTMETLKNILGDGAEDKIKNVLSSISAPENSEKQEINTDGLSQIMQLKDIIDSISVSRDNPRANLLLSLKPYMRSSRQKSIDSAVRLLGLGSITKALKK